MVDRDYSLKKPAVAIPENLENQHADDLLIFRRLLKSRHRPQFIIAEFNASGYRKRVIQHVNAAASKFYIWRLSKKEQIISFKNKLSRLAVTYDVIHIIELEHWMAQAETKIFKLLNYHREALFKLINTNVVLWLPEQQIRQLAEIAPDFWSWRAVVLDFSLSDSADIRNRILLLDPADIQKKRKRIKQISAYFQNQTDPQSGADAYLWLEKSRIHEALGEVNRSLFAAEQAYHLFKCNHNDRGTTAAQDQAATLRIYLKKATRFK